MMGWLIALGILIFLGILPLGISFRYGSEGAVVRALVGPVQWKVFPAKKKEPKPKKETKPKKQKEPKQAKETTGQTGTQKAESSQKPKEKGGPISDFLPLVYVAVDLLADFPRLFRIHRLDANVILGGSDPADLGENYGKACAALGNLWPRLEEIFVIRRRDIKMQCDFESSETKITARLDISVTIGRLLGFTLRHGTKALREFLKIMKKRKGGATV